jgi:PAS domain S-box-containing protein
MHSNTNISRGEFDDPLEFLIANGDVRDERDLRRILHRVAKDASEAITLTDTKLEKPGPRILWVNPAFTEITGYERTEVLGKTPRILQGPDTEESVLRRLRRRLEAGERFEGEALNYRKDGTPFINHWSIAPVCREDGGIDYWVAVQRDVTEKRKLEEEVVRTLDEERRRIGRDLHDSVGSLVTAASMRLENFIHRESLEPSQEEDLRDIRSTIKETYESLRRISQGLSPVDLSEGELSNALQRLASNTDNGRYHADIDLDVWLSSLDVDDLLNLYWIVYEAVTNAERHADASSIHIRASRSEDGRGETVLHLVVEDDGTGFSREAVQGESWGLRLMKYRADLLGGDVTIESSPGEGTCVDCVLHVDAVTGES